MKAELIAHFFLTMPPYRTVNPGTLCRPTKVAAANCQALSPVSSHCGEGTSAITIPSYRQVREAKCLTGRKKKCAKTVPARLSVIPLKSFMFPSDFIAWCKLMIKRKTIEQKMGSCDASIARMVLLCQATAFVIAGLLTLAVAFAAHGQDGKAAMTCTKPASGVS